MLVSASFSTYANESATSLKHCFRLFQFYFRISLYQGLYFKQTVAISSCR